MDKIKEFFGVLKRQHFWIIAPLLLIIGLVGWMMANKKLSQEYEQNKSKVQSYVSQMQTVTSQQPHPNEDYHAGMEQLIAKRGENVRAAWQRKWERQKQELKWPEDLPADFLSRVEQMRPIEKVDVERTRIPSSLRYTYGGFIKSMLPRLAKRIGAKWEPTGGLRGDSSSSRGTAGEGAAEEAPTLVQWDPQNEALYQRRFDWGSRPPTTMDVLYAQEDLWVLTTLIDIIQRTNGDALIRSQAAIKSIDFIQIGKDVNPPRQQGFKVVRPAPLGGEDGSGDTDELDDEPLSYGPDPIAGDDFAGEPMDGGANDAKMELVKNRYYNENYEPIADFDTLMSSVTVAKRIPVRMRLLMDQRKISKLLVECANAPLTFEVRQLRFNPQGVRRTGPIESLSPEGGFLSQQQAVKVLDDYESLDRTVELFGIIYIFNPVDDAVLGGEVAEVPEADDTAAVQPADRPTVLQHVVAK